MNLKQLLGKSGEEIAAEYLENKGYNIIDRNFRCVLGEIDLIVKRKGILTFVEVKTRTNEKYGKPSEAVNNIKKNHMKRSAAIFLKENNFSGFTIRFDVIEVYMINGKCKINHIKQII